MTDAISNVEALAIDTVNVRECSDPRKPSSRIRRRACQCCGCLLLLIILGYFALAYYAAHSFVQLAPKVRLVRNGNGLWTPNNITGHPFCQKALHEIGSCASDAFLVKLCEDSSSNPWQLVTFESRGTDAGQGTVRITAWWLPAKDPKAPRIVVMHGYRRNFDAFYVQISAFLLRQLGFAVLLPSLRDHGLSEASEVEYCTWGWAYPFDLLGAWDYAVHDPDGVLGGKLPSHQVGLMGFSMGGFVTALAAGLEKDVPGFWLDSAAYSVPIVLRSGISKVLGNILATLLSPAAKIFSHWISGVDLELHTPGKTLRNAQATAQKVALVHNKRDVDVTYSNLEHYLTLFNELPHKYKLEDTWISDFVCGDEDHVQHIVWSPDMYRTKLCYFWMGVFSMNTSQCENTNLIVVNKQIL